MFEQLQFALIICAIRNLCAQPAGGGKASSNGGDRLFDVGMQYVRDDDCDTASEGGGAQILDLQTVLPFGCAASGKRDELT